MTGVVLPFVGLDERSARHNLAVFIGHARSRKFFQGPHAVKWDAVSWDLRPFASTRGQNPASYVLHFTTYETTTRGRRSPHAVGMPQPFLDAAKAVAVEFLAATGMANPSKLIAVLRILEKAYRDLGVAPDLCSLTPVVLDRTAETIRADIMHAWDYGRQLERLVLGVVNGGRLATAHLLWRSPFPYHGAKRSDRVNIEVGGVETADKLPHLKSVLDLASVFRNATVGADVVTTAWFALAMFSPSRANEILTLPLDCRTEMEGVFGLSWRPLKGGDPMTKFAVNEEWAEVATTAVERLRELGATARRAAAWYVENPTRLYLPEGMEHLRGEPLTKLEICEVLGMPGGYEQGSRLDKTVVRLDQYTTDPAKTGGARSMKLNDFASIERFALSALPYGFPLADKRAGLLASGALFCLPRHVMRTDGGLQLHVPDLISMHQIFHDLGGKPNGTTVFRRHKLLDIRTGQPWKLTTHQPRHLLNTLAQSKHLSETLIAFWSGRKRVDQNQWYNHIPHEAFIEAYVMMGRHAPREIGVVGPLADKVVERARREMVPHDEALRLELGSIISTRYGLCRHNYALTPCPKDKHCIGCGENTFVKGDARQIAEARRQQATSEVAVANCRRAIAEGEPGVDRWLARHEEAAVRWALAVERMTDPAIPDGTLITLPPPQVSQTKTGLALAIHDAKSPYGEGMEEMLALGGEA